MSSRKAVAGVAAVAALALAACTPPNENPSDVKVDTATEQDASSHLDPELVPTITGTPTTANVLDANSAQQSTSAAAAADAVPTITNCGVSGLQYPIEITLDCASQDDFLRDIVWDSWNQSGAVGTATRVTVNPERVVEGVQVVLGAPTQAANGNYEFASLSVDGADIADSDWE